MSTQIGKLEKVPVIDANLVQYEKGVEVHTPVTHTEGATIDVGVYASDGQVELLALPCNLSLEQACKLRDLLDGAIHVAARHRRPPEQPQ